MRDEQRVKKLLALQEEYGDDFLKFLEFGMSKLGFRTSDMQKDIAKFISSTKYGNWKMVQAPRGEAKTTITALYAMYRIIMTPTIRVYITTANKNLASDITKLLFTAFTKWPELQCLAPSKDDRQSSEKFDVYYGFKGDDKSPTVQCNGIMSGHAGKRADLIISDDIEDEKNSMTEETREVLINKMDGLADLANNGGDWLILGTPQGRESIYNLLTSKGFTVRIWTGRVPHRRDIINYEGLLAPYIVDMVDRAKPEDYTHGLDMQSGEATDSLLNSETALLQKEVLNRSRFRLQYMLDTTLVDADTYPLRLGDILFTKINIEAGLNVGLFTSKAHTSLVPLPKDWYLKQQLYMADIIKGESIPITRVVVAVDPAGGGANADETGYAVAGQSGDRIVVLDCGGFKGGYNTEAYEKLSALLHKWSPNEVLIEKNYGNGAFRSVWENHSLYNNHKAIPIVDIQNSGQKESRICDALEPFINTKKIIFDVDIVENDFKSAMAIDNDNRRTYSIFHQIANITREKDALKHDDRIDALSMVVSYLKDSMYEDKYAIEHAQKELAEQEWFCKTYGFASWEEYIESYGASAPGYEKHKSRLVLDKEEDNQRVERTQQEDQSMIGMLL